MSTQEFRVAGMTCSHCVAAVTAEVAGIPGVASVEIGLPSGLVTVESDAPLEPAAVAAAVDEAGYEVVP